MTAFSQWITTLPELWTKEMVSAFGPPILCEEDLTEDEAIEGQAAEDESGGTPAKGAPGAEAAEDESGGGRPAKRRRGLKSKQSLVCMSKKLIPCSSQYQSEEAQERKSIKDEVRLMKRFVSLGHENSGVVCKFNHK